MKVAINAQLLSAPSFGITTYIRNLIDGLSSMDRFDEFSIFTNSLSVEANNAANFRIKRTLIDTSKPAARILWEQAFLPFTLNISGYDVFHNPDHMLPLLPVRARKVVTVHDLAFIKFPGTFSSAKGSFKRAITPLSIKKADRIIADSHSTKKDIVELFNIDQSRIDVVHLGVNSCFRPIKDAGLLSDVRSKYGLPDDYILFVGTLEKRKNIEGLIDSFVQAASKAGIKEHLVIVGKKGWLFSGVFDKLEKLGVSIKERIHIISDVDNKDLPAVYNLAKVLVYPSFYEGFGLPVLEAMACGVPVITSNVSSLPEIAEGAGILLDPNDTDGISDAIGTVLLDDEKRHKMISKGIEKAKQFSWEECARKTLDVYRKVMI